MMFGAFIVRVPATGLAAGGIRRRRASRGSSSRTRTSRVDVAWKTPQFWLLWAVLCLNVTAGIGILGQASLMCQDMFGVSAAVGGGFAGLLSLFNMGGRFFWSSTSDLTGRKAIYCVYFLLGAVALLRSSRSPSSSTACRSSSLVTAVIISMYGGGFATIPAYLRDLFGTMHLGAIHGRLITAWSMAAVLGPQLVNYVSTYRIEHGVPRAEAYNLTMYLMAGLLLVGLVCNLLVRPVDERHHHDREEPRTMSQPRAEKIAARWRRRRVDRGAIPLAWGVYQTASKSLRCSARPAAGPGRHGRRLTGDPGSLERGVVGIEGHAVRPEVIVDLAVLEVPLEGLGARDGLDVIVVQPEGAHEVGVRRAGPAQQAGRARG